MEKENIDLKKDSVIALGMFDGVHIGHRNLLQTTKNVAKKFGATPTAYTFENHPREVLGVSQNLLTLANEKSALINSLDVQTKLVRFTTEIAQLEPIAFLENIKMQFNLKAIVVGFNYYFGKKAKGDIDLLQSFCAKNKIELHVIEPVKYFDQIVSSTVIRDSLLAGDIEYSNKLLVTPYFISGSVVSRRKIGRKIGFPTANIPVQNKFLPKFGIYVTVVSYFDEITQKFVFFKSVTNVGIRPSIVEQTPASPREITVEAHILDYDMQIYSKKITVSFLKFIRPEIKLDNFELLSKQIAQDCRYAQEYFSLNTIEKVAQNICTIL